MTIIARSIGVFLLAGAASALGAKQDGEQAPLWRFDFERDGSGILPRELDPRKMSAAVVRRADGQGRCLRITSPTPVVFCPLYVRGPIRVEKNLVLEFDHRETIQPGVEGAYLGIAFYVAGKQAAWISDAFSKSWRHVEIVIPALKLRPPFADAMKRGLAFDKVQIYARSKDRRSRADSPAKLKLYLDNLRLSIKSVVTIGRGSSAPYTCHNDPPLFDWRGPTSRGSKLQYGRTPSFAPEQSVTVTLASALPFYVPDNKIGPGTWFFRRELRTDLLAGWSAAQQVDIPRTAHRYRLPPLDLRSIAAQSHPRLLPRVRPDANPISDQERTRLIRRALAAAKEGVPPHPGPYRKGDSRWPQWIDWYGKVAGRVTARTGSRLRRTAEAAMLTRAPEAVNAARELLLEACKWDPEGGSAMRYGDLQAAALLQGMVWCYDVCRDRLTVHERGTVLRVLRERVLQFYSFVSPFRMNPAQNHPWKRTTVTAESALVLMGDVPEAREWLATAAHVFAYRILPSMGADGEDAEGLSYWAYGVNMLANFADLLLFVAKVDVYDHPWLKHTCRFPVYCAPPDGYAVSFADTSSRGNAGLTGPYGAKLTALLGTRVRDPYALWYADVSDPVIPPRPPADLPQSVCWPYIGYAVFHTCLSEGFEDVTVAMRSGPYYAGHQHEDNNGFVIYAYGDKLAVDGGYYDWYGSPHFKAYSTRTVAHNTLLVDGKGQKRRTGGALRDWFDAPNFGYVVGDASNPEIYEGRLKRFERRLVFLKPRFVIAHDLVETAGKPRRLEWLLHAHTSTPFPVDSARAEFRVRRPRATLAGRFLAPAELDMDVRKSFDVPPQKPRESVFLPWSEVQPEWTLAAGLPRKTAATDFFIVMDIRRADGEKGPIPIARKILTRRVIGCELRVPWGTYLLLSRRVQADRTPLQGLGLRTDGDLAVVLLGPSGRVVDGMAVRASHLTYRGKAVAFAGPSAPPHSTQVPASPDGVRRITRDGGQYGAVAVTAPLIENGRVRVMNGCVFRRASGDVGVWWTNIMADRLYRARLDIQGWTGARPPCVRINGRTERGLRRVVPILSGSHCLTVSGPGRFDRIVLSRIRYRFVQAQRLPRDTAPAPGDIVIDPDAPGPAVESEERRGRSVEKVAATGGTAFCYIDGPVQWAEWRFHVPKKADYNLLVRTASAHSEIDREIRIDGTPFPGESSAVRLGGSGGWCRTRDDWTWDRVMDDRGRPAAIRLAPGEHTLRWEFVRGSQNIDLFVFRPVRRGVEAGVGGKGGG
ncbi:MAG: DUF4962 domain-containing protein [Kiritimatiellaeota bacterium]|nr:DUF4962 domain-containing protein [Kiritimatiellota bacterium]